MHLGCKACYGSGIALQRTNHIVYSAYALGPKNSAPILLHILFIEKITLLDRYILEQGYAMVT